MKLTHSQNWTHHFITVISTTKITEKELNNMAALIAIKNLLRYKRFCSLRWLGSSFSFFFTSILVVSVSWIPPFFFFHSFSLYLLTSLVKASTVDQYERETEASKEGISWELKNISGVLVYINIEDNCETCNYCGFDFRPTRNHLLSPQKIIPTSRYNHSNSRKTFRFNLNSLAGLVVFYGISTLVCNLMPNPVYPCILHICFVSE